MKKYFALYVATFSILLSPLFAANKIDSPSKHSKVKEIDQNTQIRKIAITCCGMRQKDSASKFQPNRVSACVPERVLSRSEVRILGTEHSVCRNSQSCKNVSVKNAKSKNNSRFSSSTGGND